MFNQKCEEVVGDELAFGCPADEQSLTTQKVTVTNKTDKKSARDKSGIEVAVSYYNNTSDISIEGYGTTSLAPAAALTLAGTYLTLAGAAFVDEVTLDTMNEDFVKSTIKGTAYEGISA
jgi:hypothetical protein